MSDQNTIDVYNRRAHDYLTIVEEVPPEPMLATFANHLQRGNRILDVGCGPGHHARYFASLGLQVDAFDASEKMVDLAMQHEGVNASVQSIEDYRSEPYYHGIWASFSLLHLNKEEMVSALHTIANALLDMGYFAIGMKLGAGAHRDTEGRFYSYYTAVELNELLAQHALTPIEQYQSSGRGLAGSIDDYIYILSQKRRS